MKLFEREQSEAKHYFVGTHRAVAPAETLRRFQPLLRELGITRLADITGLDCIGLPVYVAVRPNSRALATSQGKGFDHDSAKASAMMESIESWHAERTELPLVYDSYCSLRKKHHVVDPFELPLSVGAIPRRDTPLLWTHGWDLMTEQWTYVPFELVTLNFVFPPGFRSTFSISSNGLSSGNHLLEATVHALCEVVERDAHTLWSLRSDDEIKRSQVDLTTVDDAACLHTLSLLQRAGLRTVAWDMTSDTDIPSYVCQIFESPEHSRWRPIGSASGFGCHLSRGVAMMRALSEAVQARLTLISGSRDDTFYRHYEAASDRGTNQRIWDILSQTRSALSFPSRQNLDGPLFDDDVQTILLALRKIGIRNAVVVDLSRLSIGIPVVKVIVPGLEGHSQTASYRPGARAVGIAKKGGA